MGLLRLFLHNISSYCILFRIKDDDTSTVLFNYKGRGSPWSDTDVVQGTVGVEVETDWQVIVQYGSGPERKKREFFDETDPTEFLSFDTVVNLKRTGDCDYVDFKLKIVDKDGNEQFSIEEPLEQQLFGVGVHTFPAYGTLEFGDGTTVDFTLTGLEGISYAIADGALGKFCSSVRVHTSETDFFFFTSSIRLRTIQLQCLVLPALKHGLAGTDCNVAPGQFT